MAIPFIKTPITAYHLRINREHSNFSLFSAVVLVSLISRIRSSDLFSPC